MSNADEGVEEDINSPPASGAPRRPLSSGISSITATAFLIGVIGGGGMMLLPISMANAGMAGFFLIVFLGLTTMNNGVCLANSWMLLENCHPTLRGPSRNPFPEMARRALGVPGKIISVICLLVNQSGVCITYLLITAVFLEYIFVQFVHITKCYWIIAVVIFLLPFCLTSSLKNLWWLGYLSGATTILLWAGVIAKLFLKYLASEETGLVDTDSHSFFDNIQRIGISLGPIMLSYSDAVLFPSIQNEMKDRAKFRSSVVAAFSCLIFMYLLLSWMIYLTLGFNEYDNLITTFLTAMPGAVTDMISVLAVIHFPAVCCVVINPIFRQMEFMLNITDNFAIPRVLFRIMVLGFLLFAAEILPDFRKLMSVLSLSTMTISTYILPPALYLSVISADSSKKKWSSYHLAFMTLTIGIASVGAIYSTYTNVAILLEKGLEPSCLLHIYKCNNMTKGNSTRICVQVEQTE